MNKQNTHYFDTYSVNRGGIHKGILSSDGSQAIITIYNKDASVQIPQAGDFGVLHSPSRSRGIKGGKGSKGKWMEGEI